MWRGKIYQYGSAAVEALRCVDTICSELESYICMKSSIVYQILVQKTRKEGIPIRKISWEGSKLHRARKEKDNASSILLTLHLDTLTLLGTFHLLAATPPPPPHPPSKDGKFLLWRRCRILFFFFKGAAQIWTLWINFSKAPLRIQPLWFFFFKGCRVT